VFFGGLGLGLGFEGAGLGLGLGPETTGLGLGTLVLTTRLETYHTLPYHMWQPYYRLTIRFLVSQKRISTLTVRLNTSQEFKTLRVSCTKRTISPNYPSG